MPCPFTSRFTHKQRTRKKEGTLSREREKGCLENEKKNYPRVCPIHLHSIPYYRFHGTRRCRRCERDKTQYPCREPTPSVSLPRTNTKSELTFTSFIIGDNSSYSILRITRCICATYRTGLQRRYKGKSGSSSTRMCMRVRCEHYRGRCRKG